jgi:hypothetical protein
MKKRKNNIPIGLCYRCEKRVRFLETKGQERPRYECGDIEHSSCGCYAFEPVKPVVMQRNKGDKRPQFAGSMIAARSHGVRVAEEGKDIVCNIEIYKDGLMPFWETVWKPDKIK